MISEKKQKTNPVAQEDFLDFYFKNEKKIEAISYNEDIQTNELKKLSKTAEQLYSDIIDYLKEKIEKEYTNQIKIKKRYYSSKAVFEIKGFEFTFWLEGSSLLISSCLEPKIKGSNGGMIMWIWKDKTDNIDNYRKCISSNESNYQLNKVQFETLCKKYEQKYKKKDYPTFNSHSIVWQYFPYTTGEDCKK